MCAWFTATTISNLFLFFFYQSELCTFKSNKDNRKFFRQCLRTYDDMVCLCWNEKQVQMKCWIIICNRLRIRHINAQLLHKMNKFPFKWRTAQCLLELTICKLETGTTTVLSIFIYQSICIRLIKSNKILINNLIYNIYTYTPASIFKFFS